MTCYSAPLGWKRQETQVLARDTEWVGWEIGNPVPPARSDTFFLILHYPLPLFHFLSPMVLLLVFSLIITFAFLILASWAVGEGAEILGERYDASVLGGLIIAWLNTAPETIFFIFALESENPDFAVGAIAGSAIVVSTVALGLCLWFGAHARKSLKIILQPEVRKQCMFLGISLLGVLILSITGFNGPLAFAGVGEYVAFVVYSLRRSGGFARSDDVHAGSDDDVENPPEEEEEGGETKEKEEAVNVKKGVAFLIAGGLLILIFSEPFISAVVSAAVLMGVSPLMLAFFVAPIASEAPEIFESIALSRKGNIQNINIAVSNLVGGTLSKTTLLFGILSYYGIIKSFDWEKDYAVNMLLVVSATGLASGIGYFVNEIRMIHGKLLLVLFVCCGIVQVMMNQMEDEEIVETIVE